MKSTNQNNGLWVDNEIIEKSALGDDIKLVATDHLIVLTKAKMTAMDKVKTIDSMATLLNNLIDDLAKCCGECDGCGHCGDLDFEPIHLPDKIGRKVYGRFLSDGERCQYDRSDFIGELKEECMPDWAKEKLMEMQSSSQTQELTMEFKM